MDDDLGPYLEQAQQNPEFRDAYDDARHLQQLLDRLVELRRELGLTQQEVAARMDISQPTLSQFESERSDPHFSTVQRYARALGTRLIVDVDAPECDKTAGGTRTGE